MLHQVFPSKIAETNNFNLLRVLLAVSVIVSHAFPLSLGTGTVEPLSHLTSGQIQLGGGAVNAFFAISGFLITASWLNSQNIRDYLRRRALRIFPGFAGALLFCVFIVGPLGGASLPGYLHSKDTWKFFGNFVFVTQSQSIPGVFQYNPYPATVDVPLWTIKYEVLCYLGVVVAATVGLLKRPGIALILLVLSITVFGDAHHVATRLHLHGSIQEMPRLGTFFLAGMVFYLWRQDIPRSPWLLAVMLLLIALSLHHGLAYVLPVAGTYALFYVAYAKGLHIANFGRNWDLSYGMYLYGWPIEQLLVYRVSHITPWSLAVLATLATIPLAALSWRLIEAPAQRFKRKRMTGVQNSLNTESAITAS